MSRRLAVLALILLAAAQGCAVLRAPPPGAEAVAELRALDHRLDEAERVWFEAIDDPFAAEVLRDRYVEMQDLCRRCSRRERGFLSLDEKTLCDRVRDPFVIFHNRLKVRADRLEEQIEMKARLEGPEPNTVAYEYRRRPSEENLEKLQRVFEQVHRYYVGWPYTWTRYINKYAFQKSRSDHFRAAFLDRDREYRELARRPDADRRELRIARRRAEFAFARLKEEYVTNDLPPAGEVNAFYMARDLDDYHRLVVEEEALAALREREGRRKEVVVFVHGLSETRASWGRMPVLLAREDVAPGGPADRFFKVYVFSYDTVEDSKSVEGFKNELAGFIGDILRDEGVERVHLVGHSFGSVLCLKYVIHRADDVLRGVDTADPAAVAGALAAAIRSGQYRQTVASFTSVAGSLSGSQIANIAHDRFIPPERLFRRSLPMFRGGVPGYGDIQVRENQIGSAVNLTSFRRLDTERPLSPSDLAAADADGALRAADVPVLCLIGDPVKLQSVFRKEGLLKMGEAWDIFRFDGPIRIFDSFRRDEDDGLVKSYSANINHVWLLDSGADIGYRGASVRSTAHAHFSIARVDSRGHPTYRYITSFLNGRLIPQEEGGRFILQRCAVLIRVFPEGMDPLDSAEAFFLPEERILYRAEGKTVIPPLSIEEVTARGAPRDAAFGAPQWNRMTGVCFREGRFRAAAAAGRAVFLLRAPGFEERRLEVPVRRGETSYAVDVILQRTGGGA
ncbi:MAG: alpha/beta hydrolase [bacterium]|nr:alpha/beta hydrolase [bacterium]